MRLRRRQTPSQSLFDPEKIDLVTQDPSGGANLYVVQDQPWIDSEAETESLEQKLRTCANFALLGQMHEMYPELRGQPWKIILDTYVGPPPTFSLAPRRASLRRTGAGEGSGSELPLSLPLPPESKQAAELDDRLGVVVDAQVADPINAFAVSLRRPKLLDDDCSRLLPAAIAACSLTGFQRRQHPLRERRVGIEERAPHGGKHVGVGEHVSLYRESGFNEMACPLDTASSCVRSRASVSGNRSKLTEVRISVAGKRLIERLRWISLSGQRR